MPVTLKTTRLLLREMSLADLDFVAGMPEDAEVMRFYPKGYSRDESATCRARGSRPYRRRRSRPGSHSSRDRKRRLRGERLRRLPLRRHASG